MTMTAPQLGEQGGSCCVCRVLVVERMGEGHDGDLWCLVSLTGAVCCRNGSWQVQKALESPLDVRLYSKGWQWTLCVACSQSVLGCEAACMPSG